MVQLIPLAQATPAEMRENESRLGDQYTRMHGMPYIMRRRFLRGAQWCRAERGSLPAGGRATPMTCSAGGRQYVVICVGGGGAWGRGDSVVA